MLRPQPKKTPWRSAAYLAHVREQPCAVPGCFSEMSNTGTRHAHHEAEPGHGGKGTKPSDERTYCLCFVHHRLRHDEGRSFMEYMGVNVEAVIKRTQEEWVRRGGRREWENE